MTHALPPYGELEQVFLAHRNALRALLLRQLGDEEEASDVLQELYLHIASNPQNGRFIAEPLGYLRRMARNLSIDRLRARGRQSKFSVKQGFLTEGKACDEADNLTPERVALARERLQIMQDVLDGLPEDCRTAFLLSRCDGLTYDEIGEHLGVSRNMVKKHLVRALGELRAAMPLFN